MNYLYMADINAINKRCSTRLNVFCKHKVIIIIKIFESISQTHNIITCDFSPSKIV